MSEILIVEDNVEINDMLRECLTKEGYVCTQAFSGSEASLCLTIQVYDLILLDLMLPGESGESVLTKVKQNQHTPVIILSAKDALDTRIELLELGADDYICKPFDIKEVIARVHVQLRRVKRDIEKQQEITYLDINLNADSFQVCVAGKAVSLTKHEFYILELMIKSPKQVFTKQVIYEYAWQESYYQDDRVINTHISNLRGKLKKAGHRDYIQTVWGIGFKLID